MDTERTKSQMNETYNWHKLYRIGGIAALAIVLLIPVQIVIFAVFPPPESPIGFIELYHTNWILGLLSLDFLYYINNGLLALFYLALFASMKKNDFAVMSIAMILGFIGIASYYASSVGFEMMSISKQYYATDSPEMQQQLLAVALGMITTYKGTAFDVYYVLNAITLLLISKTMFQSKFFGKMAATWGLISGIFMMVPSTAGTLGLAFSLISLIPWIIFSIITGRKLMTMARHQEKA